MQTQKGGGSVTGRNTKRNMLIGLLAFGYTPNYAACATLVAAFAYGARSIHISHGTACLMRLVCSLCLGFTLALGKALGPLLDPEFTRWASFLLLFFLGMVRLLDSSVKSWIRRVQGRRRDISFSISRLRFILSVYADPQEADEDCSRSLSPWEAMTLSLALSLDSLAVGFGAGLIEKAAARALRRGG